MSGQEVILSKLRLVGLEIGAVSPYSLSGGSSSAAPIFAIVRSATALADDTSAQAIFAAAGDTLTVDALTTYFFDMRLSLDTGGSAHDLSLLFAGTATYTSVRYFATNNPWQAYTRGIAATATALSDEDTTTNADITITGYLSINEGGTVIPQVQFGAAPGGTNAVAIGTFIRLTAAGSDTDVASDDWS